MKVAYILFDNDKPLEVIVGMHSDYFKSKATKRLAELEKLSTNSSHPHHFHFHLVPIFEG